MLLLRVTPKDRDHDVLVATVALGTAVRNTNDIKVSLRDVVLSQLLERLTESGGDQIGLFMFPLVRDDADLGRSRR